MYLAFAGGPAIFTQDFTCPVLLRINPKSYFYLKYEAITLYGAPFQASSSIKIIYDSLIPKISGFSIPPIYLFKGWIPQKSGTQSKNNLGLG